jgi:endonuclease/exonuclease/phosphatase family metal-dependent hydrolase
VRELTALSRSLSPSLFFLCETRQNKNKVRRLRHRLGLKGFVGLSSEGFSGGLALFWHESLHVEIKGINERYIDAYIRSTVNDPPWRLTCVYGEPRVENRHRMWDALRNLKLNSDIPWLVVGDFNEAMWQEEYMSKTPRAAAQMKDFRDALADCDLHDLGFTGVPFTYDNKRSGNANVKVRLDRAVANPAWRDRFVNARVNHHVSPCSDHCPISLNIVQENNL